MPQDAPDAQPAVPVIVNTTSGLGHSPQALERLAGEFREAGIEANILPASSGTEIASLTAMALKAKPAVLVAAGGDGTMSAVAELVRGTDTAMGILPTGTLNHFAKDAGIPLDRIAAIRTIAQGRRRAIDVGEVNGRSFINNSSLGLYPDLVRDRLRQQRRLRRSRRAAMLWALLATLRRTPLLRLRLEHEGGEGHCRSPFVFIGNNEYRMQGFNIGTRERLDQGSLSIYTTSRTTAAGLFGLALRALFGRLHQADDFATTHSPRLRVESLRPRILVATDGEIRMMDTPLEYRVLPRALSILVP